MPPKNYFLTQRQRSSIVLWKRENELLSDNEIARRVKCGSVTVKRCYQRIRVCNTSDENEWKEKLFAKQQRGRPWNRQSKPECGGKKQNEDDKKRRISDTLEKQRAKSTKLLTERQWFDIIWLKQENKLTDGEIARKVVCRLRSVRDEWNKWSQKRTSFNRKSQKHQQPKKAGNVNEEKVTDHSTKKGETVEEHPLPPVEVKQELRMVVTEEGDGSFTPPTAFMGTEGDGVSDNFISVSPGEEAQFFQSGSTSLNETGNGMEISHQEGQMQSNPPQNSTFGGSRKRGRQEKNNSNNNNNGPPRKQRLASTTTSNGDGKTLAKRLQEILGIKNPGEAESTSENHLIDAVLQLKQRAETLEKQNSVLIDAITTIKEAIPRDLQPSSASASVMRLRSSSNKVGNDGEEEGEQNSSIKQPTSTTFSLLHSSSAPTNNGMRTFLNTMWEAVVRSNESGSG